MANSTHIGPVQVSDNGALAAPQMMSREWGESVPLKRIAVVTGNAEHRQRLVDAMKQSGAEVRAFTPSEIIINSGLGWKQELLSYTVVLLGGIHTNRAMLPLYARYLCFGDAAYPGGDGYVIRTIYRPFGADTTAISLEASTPEGESEAVKRFVALLSQSEDGRFPQTLEARLTENWLTKIGQQGQKGILAVLHAYSVIDNLGYYAGTGTYEECRPGNLFKIVPWGWLLKAANYFHPEQGYDWLMQNIPNTGTDTWAVSRGIADARVFATIGKQVFPEHLLGIVTVPMGKYRYNNLPHSLDDVRSSGQMYLPASEDRCFQKLCFRDSFERDGQYLALEGYQTSSADNLPPMDANSIIRYTDLGHIWLHSNSEKSGNLFRTAVFCTDGINDSIQPAGCELQAMHNGSNIGIVVSYLPDYVACDWTRNIIWRRGKYFVFIDLMRQNREGRFGLTCSFRTPQKAWLERDGVTLREGNAEAHINNVDNVQLSLEDGDELEGAAIPTLLRETQFLDGGIGSVKVFRNLVYASTPEHLGKLEARPIGEMGMMIKGTIRGEEELALTAATPQGKGLRIGPFETNAQVLYVGTTEWVQAGGEGIRIGGKLHQGSEGKSNGEIQQALEGLWAETEPVDRPSRYDSTEETTERVWRFDGFSNLPAAAPAPILTCEPEPQGMLGSLLDGIVTRSPTVRWPSDADVTLSLDLRESRVIAQIDFQTGQIGGYNTIPKAYPEPRVIAAEFSDDDFRTDIHRRELIFASDCTFEGLHKGTVFPIQRWTCQDIAEKARYIRLIFDKQIWRGGLGMNELSVRPAGANSARIIGHILRDVDGDGADEILAWSDQAELAIVRADGTLFLKKRFSGHITSVESYDDLHPDGARILVTTREARLHCLEPDGHEVWKTDFLASAEMNSDLPTGYSIGLLRKPDGSPMIMVGNYNLATFVSPHGDVLKYERLPAAYQTMTLSRGFDYNDDGKEDIVSTEVWGALSVLDADMQRRAGTRFPRGRGVMLEYWNPPTRDEAKAIICSENGIGLIHLKKLNFDWLLDVKPINDCVIADINGDGSQEIVLAKQDGYVLVYSEKGKLIKSALVGEHVRAVAAMSSDDGRKTVVAALPGRLARFSPDLTEWVTIAVGEYHRLATLDRDNLLLAFGDGAVIDAFRLSR